jgi:hypothetical protein
LALGDARHEVGVVLIEAALHLLEESLLLLREWHLDSLIPGINAWV